jgi:transcriptional regulator with XRE-family HTH domain
MGKILNSTEIGFRLRTMRQRAGLTQEQLAEMVAVTSQQIQKYESGKSKLNTDRLQQLADALSVPIQSFFSDCNDHPPMVDSEKLLIDSYRAIGNREIQESILKIAVHASKRN